MRADGKVNPQDLDDEYVRKHARPGEEWDQALEPELFKEALAQHQHRTEDLAAIARGHVHSLLVHMRNQDYPINAFMVSRELKGYLQSCRDLGLFGRDELMKLEMDLHESAQKAREAFIRQFRENDQSALPWR
ncbi:TPA: hypothetical protein NHR53_006114 [Pseudomonas aeruginosa]|uniref:hypothetical protein n=1 Tax=Pseudomonas aeruginosa TaxID=287 RepID=UPI001111E6DF|nr:hypothetical protein [Pseudomonas aeruginosa]HCE7248188.1 hypothetical protein [Pseudomonas aeruginosa]HCE8129518.1 hypothetical protein [Pseudomonas aeruginosa]HCF0447630.1 hypothetical protein [Pseudomonas aeruginosa]